MIPADPVFGFWTRGVGPQGSEFPDASKNAWQAFDRRFAIFDDQAVLKALSHWSREVQDLYLDIRIPACRSDIARLALLSAFGGTYVDAHTGPANHRDLRRHLSLMAQYDLVIPQLDSFESPMPYDRIFNSPLSARTGAPVVTDLLRRALGNLLYQRDLERKSGGMHLSYSIFDLTGPNMIRDKIVDYSRRPPDLFADYKSAVHVVDFLKMGDARFKLYHFSDYQKGGNHWKRREKSEPLFFSSGSSSA